jgi:cell division protein FtsN
VVLGLVLSAVVLVKDWLPALRSTNAPQPNPTATAERAGDAGVAAESQKTAETKPKYDFYSVLPEMEVVVPDAEIAAKAQQPAPTPNPTATPERYLLQAGSFRAAPDAEEMKAKLALLGLRAGVVAVTIDGNTWHRVRVGPYATARELDDARRTLSANGIEAIALREKQ